MSTPPPPTATHTFYANSALAVCILCPALALAPPRKFDLYTFGLGLAFCTSASFLVQARTGHGLLWHIGYRLPAGSPSGREERAAIRDGAAAATAWQGQTPAREPDWVQRRKEQEELYIDDERKGYGSLILEQVREVWRREEREQDGEGEGEGQTKE